MNARIHIISEVLLLEEQGGFRKGRSCVDSVFTLKEIIPVSYTHLDVYKRQPYKDWTKRRLVS